MFSLSSRLRLAKLALQVPADHADVDAMVRVVLAGVDLLVLDESGDDDRDEATLREFRDRLIRTQLLLGTANRDAAEAASSDVVFIDRPRWWQRPDRPHEWSLLGRGVRDARTVREEEQSYDFLVLTGGATPSSRVFTAALDHQPVFSHQSVPWFVDVAPEQAREFIDAGARRLWLGPDAIAQIEDLEALVTELAACLRSAWQSEPDESVYRSEALRH